MARGVFYLAAYMSSLSEFAEPGLSLPSWRSDLRLLLRIAGPIVLTTAAETMLSFVDFIIASQIGPDAQAAVQSGTLVFVTIYGGLLGVMLCVTTVVSQSFGARRPHD